MKSAYEKALENIENDTIPITEEFKIEPNKYLELQTILDDWMKACGYDGKMLHHTEEQTNKFIDILCDYFGGNNHKPKIQSILGEWTLIHYGNTGYTESNKRLLIESLLKETQNVIKTSEH